MKHLSKIAFAIILSLTLFACSTEETTTTLENQSELANKQMIELLNTKYNIVTTDLGNGDFKFTYPDGRFFRTNSTENTIKVSGTKLNNESIEFLKLSRGQINNLSTDEKFLNSIKTEDFISKVNNFSNLNMGTFAKPCDEHPSNEEFGDCFKREWNEFCDGFISCIAQITNPIPIAIAISIHCAAC